MKQLALCFSIFCFYTCSYGQVTTYGNNSKAGHYFQAKDAKIYYEVYGHGKPIVLLHGGLFGYIEEYENLIPKLAATNQVIAIALRGHGKSEIGHQPFSYPLLAHDVYQVIKSNTQDSVIVIGFSSGGNTAFQLTAEHPEIVKKLVAIGSSPQKPEEAKQLENEEEKLTGKELEKELPDFVKSRKQLMPEPNRWNEFVAKVVAMWDQSYFLSDTEVRKINCPVLIIAGDQDTNIKPERAVSLAKLLPKNNISLIPFCGHVVIACNFRAVWEVMHPFLL
jgi:pimeloyl-ACP methyl ester carboxylesterase